ncbi:MAG: CRTAC1 family protein [Acidobacteriia bacterium]|nr:CRTAC1 family protein [Terriglobia bacterium]
MARRRSITFIVGGTVVLAAIAVLPFRVRSQSPAAAIHFSHRPIAFTLNNGETETRYVPETMAGGVAVFDYNNDGRPDIFFTNGAEMPSLKKTSSKYWNRLFRNNADGTFTDVTEAAGLAGSGYDMGVAVGDFNNDGHEDLFVGGVHHSALYRNNGNGTFTDVTAQAGLDKPDAEFGPLWSVGGVWLDVNNDGNLDLFVTNYLGWNPDKEPTCLVNGKRDYCHPRYYKSTPDRLYRGDGKGGFTDVSGSSGIRAYPGKGMGAAIADFDGDGWMDIFVTNDKLANFLFQNLGSGKFREIALKAGVAYTADGSNVSGMGSDFRDIDNDGYPDIVFVALPNETFPLYRNTGKGFFDPNASRPMDQLTRTMGGYSPELYDFDNDGWKDLFVSRGHVQANATSREVIDQPNSVFRNLGNLAFAALTAEAGFETQPPRRHRGSAIGDLDGDGRPDVVVTALSGPAEIWMNDSPAKNHWLELKLVGTTSNRDGIGAAIKLTSKHLVQYNHVTTAAGYASSSAGPVHFGLGVDEQADVIEIRWPSGVAQRLTAVKCDRVLEVQEPGPPAKAQRP